MLEHSVIYCLAFKATGGLGHARDGLGLAPRLGLSHGLRILCLQMQGHAKRVGHRGHVVKRCLLMSVAKNALDGWLGHAATARQVGEGHAECHTL